MWTTLSGFLDRFFALAAALICAQIPQYYQQYLLCLTGHVGELSFQVKALTHTAEKTNKTVPQLIEKFLNNSDPDFHLQGELMQALVKRFESFTAALKNLQDSSLLLRPFRLLWNLDSGVAKETWSEFEFGLVFNLETLFYLVIGMCLGYLFYQGLRRIFTRK